jgi:hypothetical protein
VSSRALAPLSDPRLAALDPTYGIALVQVGSSHGRSCASMHARHLHILVRRSGGTDIKLSCLRLSRPLRTICFSRVPTERSEGIGRAAAAAAKQLSPESRVSSRALAPLSDPRLAALDPTYGIALV